VRRAVETLPQAHDVIDSFLRQIEAVEGKQHIQERGQTESIEVRTETIQAQEQLATPPQEATGAHSSASEVQATATVTNVQAPTPAATAGEKGEAAALEAPLPLSPPTRGTSRADSGASDTQTTATPTNAQASTPAAPAAERTSSEPQGDAPGAVSPARNGLAENDLDACIGWSELATSPPLPARTIAEKLGQPPELVERILRYQRKVRPFCCILDDTPQKGDPRYLHKLPDVLPALEKWVAKRLKKRAKGRG
jgi:hypothetical protein